MALSGLRKRSKLLPSQVVGVVAIVSLPLDDQRCSENEVRRAERDQPLQLDREVDMLVAVEVALDDGLVVGGAGGVLLEPVDLALDPGEGGAVGGGARERGGESRDHRRKSATQGG